MILILKARLVIMLKRRKKNLDSVKMINNTYNLTRHEDERSKMGSSYYKAGKEKEKKELTFDKPKKKKRRSVWKTQDTF